jgi:SAM-dependent methyltransferase
MKWRLRSSEKEILDQPGNSFEDIRQNMVELNTINHLLGGHSITISGFRQLAGNRKSVCVCEIGCGGGDNLAVIYKWAEKRGIAVNCTGVDINEDCIAYARRQFPQAEYLVGDYRKVALPLQPDIIFSSLFCHHFRNEELVDQLHWMKLHSRLGFFINDLHRHPLAYYAIRNLTAVFSASRLVRNDAPVSVLRGFTRPEWKLLLQEAGIAGAEIQWKWAFRWLVTVLNKLHENR